MNFVSEFLKDCHDLIDKLDQEALAETVKHLLQIRQRGGRLFLVGSGGGAGHASHAACDFRKLCNIESYAPYDNVSELTARINDEGWESSLSGWLKVSRLNDKDGIFVFSVGGGSAEKQISMNIVNAVNYAKEVGATVLGVVGKDGGYTATISDAVVIIPVVNRSLVTPLTEGFQAVIWHLLVSHPDLQVNSAKWESVATLK